MSWMRHRFAARGKPTPPPERENGIVMAISNGDRHWLGSLLQSGADVNAPHRGTLPLHFAARRGEFDIVDMLIARGADIDARDERGRTALMDAALKKDAAMLAGLLARGADVHQKDYNGQTALHHAAHIGAFDIAAALVIAGAEADAEDYSRQTPRALIKAAGRHAETTLENAEKQHEQMVSQKTAELGRSLCVMKPAAVRSRISPRG